MSETFRADIRRGHLSSGEPLEALYGAGWWTRQPERLPPVVQCRRCDGQAHDLGDRIDCENCGMYEVLADQGGDDA